MIAIEDDADTRLLAAQVADDFGIELILCPDLTSGRQAMADHPDAAVITDHRLPDGAGASLRDEWPGRDIVVFTDHDVVDSVAKPSDAMAFESALELLLDVARPVALPSSDDLAQIAGRFPGGADRYHLFLGRLAAGQGDIAVELQSGDPERIVRVCHDNSPTVGILGCTGLAATLRRLEVATRNGITTAPIAAMLGRRIAALQWTVLATA